MNARRTVLLFFYLTCVTLVAQTWTADNGNGTYSNPLFFDEFADPDIIRVGQDLRYHDGTFYIFANVNRQTTQMFRSSSPRGPWTRTPMKRGFHDLSVLFDDDGKVCVVWGYQDIRIAQLDAELTDIVPGTERLLIGKEAGMGEGLHLYKIKGKGDAVTGDLCTGLVRKSERRSDGNSGAPRPPVVDTTIAVSRFAPLSTVMV